VKQENHPEAELKWHPFECYIHPEHHYLGFNRLSALPNNILSVLLSLHYYFKMSLGHSIFFLFLEQDE